MFKIHWPDGPLTTDALPLPVTDPAGLAQRHTADRAGKVSDGAAEPGPDQAGGHQHHHQGRHCVREHSEFGRLKIDDPFYLFSLNKLKKRQTEFVKKKKKNTAYLERGVKSELDWSCLRTDTTWRNLCNLHFVRLTLNTWRIATKWSSH